MGKTVIRSVIVHIYKSTFFIMQTSWVCTIYINMLVLAWIQVITIDSYWVESDLGWFLKHKQFYRQF